MASLIGLNGSLAQRSSVEELDSMRLPVRSRLVNLVPELCRIGCELVVLDHKMVNLGDEV